MSDIELFNNFSEDQFESSSNENGFTFWWASDLMSFMDYSSRQSFDKIINKSMQICHSLNIPIIENFIQEIRDVNDKQQYDYKLSRFACYLTVMNGDSKKEPVAKAQVYFAGLAGAVHNYMIESQKVERLQVRDEISDREKSLSGVAKQAGVVEYGFFQNAGYRGMYNQNINRLKLLRNVPQGKSLLDFMGKDELAANLFRITQTELKIKNENIKGQQDLENAAHTVGKQVRETMIKISNVPPENLPPHEDIKTVKSQLKQKGKELKKIDQNKKRNKPLL
jgi:DNA-damage-inducible protein D